MAAALILASFVISLGAVRLLLSPFARFAIDRPNERSLHERPVPRTGGIAVLLGTAAAMGLAGEAAWLPFVLALALAAVSLVDDVRGMPSGLRFAAHLGAAAFYSWYVLAPMAGWQLVLIIVALAWLTNLYNFMDGADGLAGGMAVIGFGSFAVAARLAAEAQLFLLCAALAAGSLAFLLYNFHPARIFLGDVGSIPLGFLAGAIGILGWRDDVWPLWFPLVAFGPFVGDATLTLLRRTWRRQRLWQAHRDHYYQRLVRLGFGHRGTAYLAYALMLFCAALALCGIGKRPLVQWGIVALTVIVLGSVAVWVDLQWIRKR